MEQAHASDALRDISKALFGNRYKLEVAVAVQRSDGLVYAHGLSQQLHALAAPPPASNQVASVLSAFASAGIMQRLEGVRGRDPVHYQRLQSAFWELCEALWEEMSEEVRRTS